MTPQFQVIHLVCEVIVFATALGSMPREAFNLNPAC